MTQIYDFNNETWRVSVDFVIACLSTVIWGNSLEPLTTRFYSTDLANLELKFSRPAFIDS